MHPECKYCDNPMPPATIDGDVVCSRCGAEWADAKIMVETDYEDVEYWIIDDHHEDELLDDDEDEDYWDALEAMERKAAEEW